MPRATAAAQRASRTGPSCLYEENEFGELYFDAW